MAPQIISATKEASLSRSVVLHQTPWPRAEGLPVWNVIRLCVPCLGLARLVPGCGADTDVSQNNIYGRCVQSALATRHMRINATFVEEHIHFLINHTARKSVSTRPSPFVGILLTENTLSRLQGMRISNEIWTTFSSFTSAVFVFIVWVTEWRRNRASRGAIELCKLNNILTDLKRNGLSTCKQS